MKDDNLTSTDDCGGDLSIERHWKREVFQFHIGGDLSTSISSNHK
jgi:hypothetical protein